MIFRTAVLSLVACIAYHCDLSAGDSHKGPRVGPARAVNTAEILTSPVNQGSNLGGGCTSLEGDSIGFTIYDYITNGSAYRNLINYDDLTLSLARLAATDSTNLGSWFACSTDDGFTWGQFTPVEMLSGAVSTSIDKIEFMGGAEAVFSVSQGDLQLSVDNAKCGYSWTTYAGVGAHWPRVALGSASEIYVISSDSSLPGELCLATSVDFGATWNAQCGLTPPGVVIEPDGYDIAARGNSIAYVVAGTGGDVMLARSSDNGNTWLQQIIYDAAGPGELPPGNTQWQPDGACAIVIDHDGDPHVVWSNYLAVGDSNSNPELFYSTNAGIMYRGDSAGVLEIALPVQDSTMGTPPGRDGNYASQPDIAIDDDFDLPFVLFSQLIPERDDSMRNYQHIYGVCSYDGGLTWGEPSDITYGSGFDASFPSVADRVDRGGGFLTVHIVYNCDRFAGNWVSGNHPQIPVTIKYLRHGYIDLSADPLIAVPGRFGLEQNYPNPFNPSTSISFSLPRSSNVSLKVFNLLGEEVVTLVHGHEDAGPHTVQWDAGGQPSGVYFYRFKSGDFVETKKLILVR